MKTAFFKTILTQQCVTNIKATTNCDRTTTTNCDRRAKFDMAKAEFLIQLLLKLNQYFDPIIFVLTPIFFELFIENYLTSGCLQCISDLEIVDVKIVNLINQGNLSKVRDPLTLLTRKL